MIIDHPENETSEAPAGATGPEVIRALAKTLPNRPGVYRMIDRDGTVLYVGKARSLKARVGNYTRLLGQTNRIAAMIALTAGMEFVTTETEAEALLLEANLIKKLKPRYNVVLRDDKSFPYILIAKEHQVPQIGKHRGARTRKGSYYGPFASAGAVNRTINALQKAFLLRSCSDSVFENRAAGRAFSIRSSAARRRARARSTARPMTASCARRRRSSPARAGRSRRSSAPSCRRRPIGSISSRPRAIATASPP